MPSARTWGRIWGRRTAAACATATWSARSTGSSTTPPAAAWRPHAPPPKSAQLDSYAVQEVNGFVFAYWDRHGREPAWQIPDISPDGWAGRSIVRRRLRSHPQATTENSVDFGHLSHVHGYGELKQLAPTVIDGPVLRAFYAFRRKMLTRGLRRLHMSVNIEISVFGLGVSLVAVHSPATDLRVLQWVIATPVDGSVAAPSPGSSAMSWSST